MKIQPQLFIMPKQNDSVQFNRDNKSKNQTTENRTYNPIYYSDFNINFGARLNRSPANFYAQPFNKAGMPKSMKDYLYDDYEDRQNVPPAQMMKIVFEPINYTDNLEEVKELFPDEPLFQNLRNEPNRKSRTGVLAEIELMSDEDKTLFKNGKNDLGMYLLKKIYLEGKSLKEINTDFSKDISSAYEGLSPIDYDTFSAYGIKMPNRGFWKSFLATRADFPYEYKPRKAFEHSGLNSDKFRGKRELTLADIDKIPQTKGKFDDIKDWELDKLAKALIEGKGSNRKTRKALQKTSVKNNESLNFVAKYLRPIMLVTLDRIHASDEMKDFFANYDSLNKSQRERMRSYWNTTQMHAFQSLIMKDTIKLFMNEYGADGDNEEFRFLLEYAAQIPEERRLRAEKHDIRQREYDEIFALPDNREVSEIKDKDEVQTVKALIDKNVPEQIDKEYVIKISDIIRDGNSFKMSETLRKEYNRKIAQRIAFLPQVIKNKYTDFLNNHPLATDEYKIADIWGNELRDEVPKLMSKEETDNIRQTIGRDFLKNNKVLMLNYTSALAEICYAYGADNASKIYGFAGMEDVIEIFDSIRGGTTEEKEQFKREINQKFKYYQKPLTVSENNIVTSAFLDTFKSIDTNNNHILNNSKIFMYTVKIAQRILADRKYSQKVYKNCLRKQIIKDLGGNTRAFKDENIPRKLLFDKALLMIGNDASLATVISMAATHNINLINEVIPPFDNESLNYFNIYHLKHWES